MVQQHKTCTGCGETKLLDGFAKQKAGKYGVTSRCKSCQAEYHRRYYESNREKSIERVRSYREDNLERVAERSRRYYESNRDRITEYDRRYHEVNREVRNAGAVKRRRKEQELSKAFTTVPKRTPYLPGEDAFILAENGMTLYQKAVELGRTFTSVKRRRERLLAKLNA